MLKLCKFILFIYFSVFVLGCAYTEKIKDHLLPDSAYNETVVKADFAMREGNWAKAAMLYDLASEIKPGNLELLFKEAEAYRNLGSQVNAIKVYKKIIESNPEADEYGEINDRVKEEAELYLSKLSNKKQLNLTLSYDQKINPDDSYLKLDAETDGMVANDNSLPALELNESQMDISSKQAEAKASKDLKTGLDKHQLNENIEKIIYHWANAWQVKDIEAYFSHYADHFDGGLANHTQWMRDRASKIKSARVLDVRVKNISINIISSAQINVSFYQAFSSDAYRDEGEKHLKLNMIDGKWLITEELFIKKS